MFHMLTILWMEYMNIIPRNETKKSMIKFKH